MLRITTTANESTGIGILLIAEGRLVGPWVKELESALANAVQNTSGPVSIDLSAVGFADAMGLELLCRLRDQGVVLRAVSSFVQELLNMNR